VRSIAKHGSFDKGLVQKLVISKPFPIHFQATYKSFPSVCNMTSPRSMQRKYRAMRGFYLANSVNHYNFATSVTGLTRK
jgi:hypothetical protein